MHDIELLTQLGESFVVEIVWFYRRRVSICFGIATTHKCEEILDHKFRPIFELSSVQHCLEYCLDIRVLQIFLFFIVRL